VQVGIALVDIEVVGFSIMISSEYRVHVFQLRWYHLLSRFLYFVVEDDFDVVVRVRFLVNRETETDTRVVVVLLVIVATDVVDDVIMSWVSFVFPLKDYLLK